MRNDSAWLDALGAQVVPDPTTAGDFLRRFNEQDAMALMEIKNTIRRKIWEEQPNNFKKEAVNNIDGTISETYDKCK